MTDNTPEDERDWDPPGNEERTGHEKDPDSNFGGGDTVNPEDRSGERIPEDADGNFGDDPVSEPDDDTDDETGDDPAGGTSAGP